MEPDVSRVPVIIGVGQALDRTDDPNAALDTLRLMKAAILAAAADARIAELSRIDGLFVVEQLTWPAAHWPAGLKIHPPWSLRWTSPPKSP